MTEAQQDILEYLEHRSKNINSKITESLEKTNSPEYISALLGRSDYIHHGETLNRGIAEPALYLLNSGGKRWRPALMLLIIEALGKDPEKFMEFSIIPEVVHNATLIHDDIEDGSMTRRNVQCVHVKYGTDVAVNLADFMYYYPISTLSNSKKLSANMKNALFSTYITEMLRVGVGQATDIAWHRFLVDPYRITEENYMQMVFDKTGALSGMAAKLGAVLGGGDEKVISACGKFGATIGVAFQLQDDLLNITNSGVSKSKGGLGEDITEGKMTLLAIYALHHSKREEGKRLLEILKSHTRDPILIAEAIKIILKSGAEEHLKNLENKLLKEAWSSINKNLEESEAKKKIKRLAEFMINREI